MVHEGMWEASHSPAQRRETEQQQTTDELRESAVSWKCVHKYWGSGFSFQIAFQKKIQI